MRRVAVIKGFTTHISASLSVAYEERCGARNFGASRGTKFFSCPARRRTSRSGYAAQCHAALQNKRALRVLGHAVVVSTDERGFFSCGCLSKMLPSKLPWRPRGAHCLHLARVRGQSVDLTSTAHTTPTGLITALSVGAWPNLVALDVCFPYLGTILPATASCSARAAQARTHRSSWCSTLPAESQNGSHPQTLEPAGTG